MARVKWTDEAAAWFRTNYSKLSTTMLRDELRVRFGIVMSHSAVCGKAFRWGLAAGGGRKADKAPRKARVPIARPVYAPKMAKPAPQVSPVPMPTIDDDTIAGVAFADLEPGMCAWPIRDGFYCGQPTAGPRVSYCDAHASRSFKRNEKAPTPSVSAQKRARVSRGWGL